MSLFFRQLLSKFAAFLTFFTNIGAIGIFSSLFATESWKTGPFLSIMLAVH